MKIKYEDWNPRPKTLDLVYQAEQIIKEYQSAGYTLTLRQLYYQFVARDIIENSERSYKNSGSMITRARLAGLISWEAIEDRNREHKSFYFCEDELQPLRSLPYFIKYDFWDRQKTYVEVWVEKEALGNVVSRACNSFFVPHLACKGYLSASEAWRAGMRFSEQIDHGKNCVLIHLGDHDSSGIDMTRDNRERIDIFTGIPGEVEVERIALNMDQVDQYSPPPNPAKMTDPRAKEYIKKYGDISWELDALEPKVIQDLIENKISSYIDEYSWDDVTELQEKKRELLEKVADNWSWIKNQLK